MTFSYNFLALLKNKTSFYMYLEVEHVQLLNTYKSSTFKALHVDSVYCVKRNPGSIRVGLLSSKALPWQGTLDDCVALGRFPSFDPWVVTIGRLGHSGEAGSGPVKLELPESARRRGIKSSKLKSTNHTHRRD